MKKNPLKPLEKSDEKLYLKMNETRRLAFEEGVIPEKYKLLIGLAVDANEGTVDGVRSFARQVLDAGGTKEEIMEVLRIVYYIGGAIKMYPAAVALEDMPW